MVLFLLHTMRHRSGVLHRPGEIRRNLMRKLIICVILGAAALLSACGTAPAQDTANQVGTAVSGSDAATAVSLGSTVVAAPEAGTAEALVGTAVAAPEAGTAEALVGTAVAAPEAGTAEAVVSGAV